MTTVFGNASPQVEGSGFNETQFLIQQWVMMNVNTAKLVIVNACSTSDGDAQAGTVDVTPLLNQMTAQRNPIPHGPLFKLPYLRMQAGSNAIIMDPVPGDVGLAIFADRDISSLKNALLVGNKKPQNPGSFRAYNWSDGLYLGGFLNAAPSQYVQLGAGINLVTPAVSTSGNLDVGTGANGTFTTPTGQTVTVVNGIIINIA